MAAVAAAVGDLAAAVEKKAGADKTAAGASARTSSIRVSAALTDRLSARSSMRPLVETVDEAVTAETEQEAAAEPVATEPCLVGLAAWVVLAEAEAEAEAAQPVRRMEWS